MIRWVWRILTRPFWIMMYTYRVYAIIFVTGVTVGVAWREVGKCVTPAQAWRVLVGPGFPE